MEQYELERLLMQMSTQLEDMAYRLSVLEDSVANLHGYVEENKNKNEEETGYA